MSEESGAGPPDSGASQDQNLEGVSILTWSKDNVQTWLKGENFSDCAAHLAKMNGKNLALAKLESLKEKLGDQADRASDLWEVVEALLREQNEDKLLPDKKFRSSMDTRGTPVQSGTEPTTTRDVVDFLSLAADEKLNLEGAIKKISDFRFVKTSRQMADITQQMEKLASIVKEADELADKSDSAASTVADLNELFDIDADFQNIHGTGLTEHLQALRIAENESDSPEQLSTYESPCKSKPPSCATLVAGRFSEKLSSGAAQAIVTANSNKKWRRLKMSELPQGLPFEPLNEGTDIEVHKTNTDVLSDDARKLCELLHKLVFQCIQQAILTGNPLSEALIQRIVLPATQILANALEIKLEMKDGRNCPKLVLVIDDAKSVAVGFMDIYGVMNYSNSGNIDVACLDIELKSKQIGCPLQLRQIQCQLLALVARQTKGRDCRISEISKSPVRCCLGVLCNGIAGLAVTWVGPEELTNKQKFQFEKSDETTGAFGLIAKKMIKSKDLRDNILQHWHVNRGGDHDMNSRNAGRKSEGGGGGGDGDGEQEEPGKEEKTGGRKFDGGENPGSGSKMVQERGGKPSWVDNTRSTYTRRTPRNDEPQTINADSIMYSKISRDVPVSFRNSQKINHRVPVPSRRIPADITNIPQGSEGMNKLFDVTDADVFDDEEDEPSLTVPQSWLSPVFSPLERFVDTFTVDYEPF